MPKTKVKDGKKRSPMPWKAMLKKIVDVAAPSAPTKPKRRKPKVRIEE